MRRILVEHARSRRRAKRGGDAQKISIEDGIVSLQTIAPDRQGDSREGLLDMLALDEAMSRLEVTHPRKIKVVEMRFFGGMENREIGEVLSISPKPGDQRLELREAWLRRELEIVLT